MAGSMKGGDALKAHLKQTMEKLQAKTVRVGFLEGATYPDGGMPVAQVAAIQEFGAPGAGIPSRPFFRDMVSENKGGWGDALRQVLESTGYDAEKALEIMGLGISDQLQESIRKLKAPELSPVTLLLRERFWSNREEMTGQDVVQARKDIQHDVKPNVTDTQAKPLIWTGHMLNSVGHEVVDGSGE